MRNSLKKCKEKEKVIPKKINNYTIEQKIIEMNSSSFYTANNTYINEKVLIRIFSRKYLNQNLEEITHINNEIFLLKLINHKNILRLYEIIESKDFVFIIYEYFQGEILTNFIKNKKLKEKEILMILYHIIIAMIYLHHIMGISHLTINLDSFLIDKDLNIKLINFKYSCIDSKDMESFQNNKDMLLFNCPEIHARQKCSPESADVYSCGIIIYYLYVGELPFNSKTKIINDEMIMKGEYTLPENTSEKMFKVITTLMENDSNKRKKFKELLNEDWFKDIINKNEEKKEMKGINILHDKFPIDENVMKICENYKLDKKDIFKYLNNNIFNSITSLYKQIEKKLNNKGIKTMCDLYSEKFFGYLNNNSNHYDNKEFKSNHDKIKKEKHHDNDIIKENIKKIENNQSEIYEGLKIIKNKCNNNNFTKIKKEDPSKMTKRRRSKIYSEQITNNLNKKKKEENNIKKVNNNDPTTFLTTKEINTQFSTNEKIENKDKRKSIRRKTNEENVNENHIKGILKNKGNKRPSSEIKDIKNTKNEKRISMDKNKVSNFDEFLVDFLSKDEEEKKEKNKEIKENNEKIKKEYKKMNSIKKLKDVKDEINKSLEKKEEKEKGKISNEIKEIKKNENKNNVSEFKDGKKEIRKNNEHKEKEKTVKNKSINKSTENKNNEEIKKVKEDENNNNSNKKENLKKIINKNFKSPKNDNNEKKIVLKENNLNKNENKKERTENKNKKKEEKEKNEEKKVGKEEKKEEKKELKKEEKIIKKEEKRVEKEKKEKKKEKEVKEVVKEEKKNEKLIKKEIKIEKESKTPKNIKAIKSENNIKENGIKKKEKVLKNKEKVNIIKKEESKMKIEKEKGKDKKKEKEKGNDISKNYNDLFLNLTTNKKNTNENNQNRTQSFWAAKNLYLNEDVFDYTQLQNIESTSYLKHKKIKDKKVKIKKFYDENNNNNNNYKIKQNKTMKNNQEDFDAKKYKMYLNALFNDNKNNDYNNSSPLNSNGNKKNHDYYNYTLNNKRTKSKIEENSQKKKSRNKKFEKKNRNKNKKNGKPINKILNLVSNSNDKNNLITNNYNDESNDYYNDKTLNEYWNSINDSSTTKENNYHKRIKSCNNYPNNNNNNNNKKHMIEIKKDLNNKFYQRENRSVNTLHSVNKNKIIRTRAFSNEKQKINSNIGNYKKDSLSVNHIKIKNKENKTIKNKLNQTRNTNSYVSEFSFITSNNLSLEELKNKLKEKLISITEGLHSELIVYNGPINLKCISFKNYEDSINNLINKIKINGYQYYRINDNLFKCTKGNKVIDIEIVKIKGNLLYYLIKK